MNLPSLVDYLIVGAGPTALTLAFYFGQLGKTVHIIEQYGYVGGCHHAQWVVNEKQKNPIPQWTEHGPRIYVDNYFGFQSLLHQMGHEWSEFFVPYDYQLQSIASQAPFSPREWLVMGSAFLGMSEKDRWITVSEFAIKHHFSQESLTWMDRACRLSDGAEASRYSLYQFFNIVNQNALYKIYQPRYPTDHSQFGFIEVWKQYLISNTSTTFSLFTHLTDVDPLSKVATLCNDEKCFQLPYERLILAIPPENVSGLAQKVPSLSQAFPLQIWEPLAQRTKYVEYLSLTYQWNNKFPLKRVHGFPRTTWGIVFIVQSDYTHFEGDPLVITSAITVHDQKGTKIGKLPKDCTRKELIEESFHQLQLFFPESPLPRFDNVTTADNEWDKENREWRMKNRGYVRVASQIGQPSPTISPISQLGSIYSCGAHNGASDYSFTALETAVQCAMALALLLEPSLKQLNLIKPFNKLWTVRQVIACGCVLSVVIILLVLLVVYGFK